MLEILFDDQLNNGKILRKELYSFGYNISISRFDSAGQAIDKCINLVNEEVCITKETDDEVKKNQLFVLSVYIGMYGDYLGFWKNLIKGNYSNSWVSLQDLLDSLRIIKKYNKNNHKFFISFLENQLTGIEKLYPYKWFASPEVVIKVCKCSICGKDINGLDCEHLIGELYSGELAFGIATEIESIIGVALVRNPKDKRCVEFLEDNEKNFRSVSVLKKAISELDISPWEITGVRETIRKRKTSEFEVKNGEVCPCGSGKKFDECCTDKEYIEIPHFDILVKDS